jgi:hypothetical protein
MPRKAHRIRIAPLALVAAAIPFVTGCEPAAKPVDAAQVRPAGSAPTEKPGHTVKFDSNQNASSPAAGSGAATSK